MASYFAVNFYRERVEKRREGSGGKVLGRYKVNLHVFDLLLLSENRECKGFLEIYTLP